MRYSFLVMMAIILLVSPCLASSTVTLAPYPAGQDILSMDKTISIPANSRARILDLLPGGGWQSGKHYEFRVDYSGQFAFVTGRKYQQVQRKKDGSVTTSTLPEQVLFIPQRARNSGVGYGFQIREFSDGKGAVWNSRSTTNSDISLNYIMPEENFSTMDNVARWQEQEANALYRDLARAPVRLGISIMDKEVRFFINGVYIRNLDLPKDALASSLLQLQKNTTIDKSVLVSDLDSRFQTIDISERLNARTFSGGISIQNLPAGETISVHGIPFQLSEVDKRNHVDLSMSWMEAAMRSGYGITEVYTRWRSAADKVPLRYQFRAPVDNYEALYVLAASEDRKNTIPRFTAQFYLPRRGRPINFPSGDIPAFNAGGRVEKAFPVTLSNGKQGNLYLVKVKLEPGQLTKFNKSPFFDFELTKDVQTYRAYPDPLTHSLHGAGLPSSVKVFGITFARSRLRTALEPDTFANIWREGESISYRVELENTTQETASARLSFRAVSYDGGDEYTKSITARIKPGASQTLRFSFKPKKFGHYNVTLEREYAGERQTFARTLAHLRKRDYTARSFDHKGMFFGAWSVGSVDTVRLAGMMGMDGFSGLNPENEEAFKLAKEFGMKDFWQGRTNRVHSAFKGNKDPVEDMEVLQKNIPPLIREASDVCEPAFSAILTEPGGIGTGNAGFGEYFGEAPYLYTNLDEKQKQRYENYKYAFLLVRKAVKQMIPQTKILMPNGSWNFTIPYLQDPETRHLFDGVKCDFQFYTRLPEEQMHQCSIHSMYYFNRAWEKYRPGETPILVFGEGPDISPVYPGGSTEKVSAAHRVRCSIIMAGYGANHQYSWGTSVDQSGGENHCTGGFMDNEVSLNPELSYSAFATHTRHMRDALFESYTNPGSFSAYCANFRNHKTGQLVRLIWSVRGKREFTIDASVRQLTVYDAMDNIIQPKVRNGRSIIVAGQMPLYVYGTDEKSVITLGAIDHGDARPGKYVTRLGNAADLFTEQTKDADENYVDMMPEYIRRFPATMKVTTETDAELKGGKALAISLPEQKIDRGVMPYFTCLKPKAPIPIKGKGSHLLIRVKANSDWGRIVYVLRDAKGKLWYSVGLKGQWNADDMPGDSVFCFDGWRLLRYELPAHAPWDLYREVGMTNWGCEDSKSVVELPLAIEKIFIERRSSVMYGNSLHRIDKETPVLLGELFVEYATKADQEEAVVALSRLRTPAVSAGALPNPIAKLAQTGTLAPGRITGVEDPDTWFDGTRGVFSFEMPPEAVSADLWVSLHEDGRGALRLGKALKKSPAQVQGFLAGVDFYAFLVYQDKEGRVSRPSRAFPFKMIDHFAHQ